MDALHSLLGGFAVALSFTNIALMFAGVILGVIIGVLPGLGGANGVAILHEALTRGEALDSPAATRRYLAARLRDYPHEVFAALFLDNRHRVIAYEELFRGTIDGTSVHPREVVKRALAHNAAALILAHNHPSGIAEPSSADTALTRRLRDALGLVEIRVLDHLVVGDGEVVSLAERGLF